MFFRVLGQHATHLPEVVVHGLQGRLLDVVRCVRGVQADVQSLGIAIISQVATLELDGQPAKLLIVI